MKPLTNVLETSMDVEKKRLDLLWSIGSFLVGLPLIQFFLWFILGMKDWDKIVNDIHSPIYNEPVILYKGIPFLAFGSIFIFYLLFLQLYLQRLFERERTLHIQLQKHLVLMLTSSVFFSIVMYGYEVNRDYYHSYMEFKELIAEKIHNGHIPPYQIHSISYNKQHSSNVVYVVPSYIGEAKEFDEKRIEELVEWLPTFKEDYHVVMGTGDSDPRFILTKEHTVNTFMSGQNNYNGSTPLDEKRKRDLIVSALKKESPESTIALYMDFLQKKNGKGIKSLFTKDASGRIKVDTHSIGQNRTVNITQILKRYVDQDVAFVTYLTDETNTENGQSKFLKETPLLNQNGKWYFAIHSDFTIEQFSRLQKLKNRWEMDQQEDKTITMLITQYDYK